MEDTIAAIATPPGRGGIAIVRISGPAAIALAERLFVVRRTPRRGLVARRVYYGTVTDPETGVALDDGLLTCMPGPHSFTGEDIAELSIHGGTVPARETLALCLAHGARQAEAGEFTLRAFINGRLDLVQAEAVLDLIQSRTSEALQVAHSQLEGGLSRRIVTLRGTLLQLLAQLQASVDFDEVDPPEMEGVDEIAQQLRWLIAEAERGAIYREGVRAAIVGRPNVGKSSLLNALLRAERAIVTPVPGTTRDTLEEAINLRGVPLVLVDTAGLVDASDPVERIGVERARRALAEAQLAIVVYDGSVVPQAEDRAIAELAADKAAAVVLNKADLGSVAGYQCLLEGVPHVLLSAVTGEGLEALEEVLAAHLLQAEDTQASPAASNPRHRALLQRALASVEAVQQALHAGEALDLISIDLQEAVSALGEITGEQATTDLLESIFGQFCVGK
ncbi:MAG: tRNA uridine-5-carboxymethylaminomethyl(34) synthesis GTPase MnmE [Anaerolineae bacterium]|nr:tRNA uridine-5-carboxymethylaminomethyl(34) synthesis GTPase MnmE [Chloroflexota bacterium]